MSGKILPVRVAVRIRPISSKEVQEGCTQCLHVTEGEPQVVLSGTEKAFTYDFVFDTSRSQQELYDTAVKNMLDSLFQGYNVTILAYGQTGSGKTYTMGTAYSQEEGMTAETGVIPRAMSDLFRCIAERTADTELLVKVSFLEIYKEQVFDLLSDGARADTAVEIREDAKGIKVAGLTEVTVTTVTETMTCLERGGQSRVTGATAMNMRSSRSHAIFTVTLEQRALDSGQIITAKLHLVDLAGSERAKKTQATGTRFQEGVNINKGLLSLGNVISALGENKPAKHVPYRDSKLTRMLQESLGGNSHTLMIACTSPADSNLEETVSTLRYADRARKIKNKPVVNREGGEAARLRQQVRELQEQLMTGGGGPAVSSRELELLRLENARLMTNLQAAIEESAVQSEKMILAERAHDQLKQQLEELYQHTGEGMTRAADAGGADVALLQELQVRVLQLQSDQTTHEEELRRLDVTRHAAAACPGGAAAAAADGSVESDQDEEQQLLKRHELRQVELNKELLDLNRDLALKESLAVEMESNSVQLARVRERYERAQRELEAQVSQLTEEKRRLETALQGARTDASGTAESSQKRQRVLQLEQRIKELHYKMKEQERLARMKRAADEKVVKLNGDIQSIKQARVRLLRQMREDADKFRQWRQQKDREVQQLRAQDRKRQVQLVKLERQHTKQETVLRRKMEHAVAANRRLKEALDVQRSARDRRQGAASGGAAAALAQLDQELELQVSTRLAQRSLDNLLEDRRRITQQISDMEGELQRDLPAEEMAQVTRTIRDLQSDLQSRSAQITDLQHRLVETDGRVAPPAAPQRWPALTSMTDTKQAMAHLFEQVVSSRSDAGAKEADTAELQTQLEETLKQLEEQESQQRELRRQQERELNRLTLDYEEKVLLLLRHMPPPARCSTPEPGSRQETDDGAAALQRRLELQQAEIQRLSELHDQLTERNAEVERLRQQLAERQAAPMPPRPRPPKPRKVAATPEVDMMVSSDESDVDDVARDPNWQRTPLFKRISKITSRASKMARSGAPHLAPPTLDSDSENQDPAEAGGDTASGSGMKRNSDGAARCKCVGKCIRCPCRASGQACEASCDCRAAHCRNRGPAAAAAAAGADETFTLGAADATFLVPEKKANKKARRLTLVPTDGSDFPDAGQRVKTLSKFDEE